MSGRKFVLLGVAGYVASRHLKAIQDTGSSLLASMDPNDSVGILDDFFPDSAFFTDFGRFKHYINTLREKNLSPQYLSVCTPDHWHEAHIRYGLENGMYVICEKPLTLDLLVLDTYQKLERQTGNQLFTILQLRYHKSIIALRRQVQASAKSKVFDVDLTYLTTRGKWFAASWKGNRDLSGGILANIGIHFFDMLQWIFGGIQLQRLHVHTQEVAAGYMELKKARVRWCLSTDYDLLPEDQKVVGQRTYRALEIDKYELEFSAGFENLHTVSYQKVFDGNGLGIEEARPSIKIIHQLQNMRAIGRQGDYHPVLASMKE